MGPAEITIATFGVAGVENAVKCHSLDLCDLEMAVSTVKEFAGQSASTKVISSSVHPELYLQKETSAQVVRETLPEAKICKERLRLLDSI